MFYLRKDLVKQWSKKNDFSPKTVSIRSPKRAWWDCKECGHSWNSLIYNRTNKNNSGCPKCSIKKIEKDRQTKTRNLKIGLFHKHKEIMKDWDYDKNIIDPRNIVGGSNYVAFWKCFVCKGKWKTKVSHRVYSFSACPYCYSTSKGNDRIDKFLKENNIMFEREYRLKDCVNKKVLPFDFYIPSINMCIEYQGLQHYESSDFFGGESKFKNRLENDKIKVKYCRKNKIKLLIIPYWNFNKLEKIIHELCKKYSQEDNSG